MQTYQIIVPILSILMITKALSHTLRGEKTIRELVSWIVVWGGIALIALFPETTDLLARVTGIKSSINALIFIALGILFFVVFKLILVIEKVEQDITQIVRHHAIESAEEREKNANSE